MNGEPHAVNTTTHHLFEQQFNSNLFFPTTTKTQAKSIANMWSGFSSFGMYGGFDDYGPNRSGWADKSDAALRREREADGLFDAFLQKCSALDAADKSLFPITEEVVKASPHLTDACYKSFRKRVLAKGCKVKRREATPAERLASGDKRKGKLYVISITCSVHPSKAEEAKAKEEAAAAARKAKAKAAAERKAEKEKKEREERERLAALHRARVREQYAKIVGEEEEDEKETDDSNKRKKKDPTKATAKTEDSSSTDDSKSSGTLQSFVEVTSAALLKHAQTMHDERKSDIRTSIFREQDERLTELRRKQAEEEAELRRVMTEKRTKLLDAADKEYSEIKGKIEAACSKKAPATNAAAAKGQDAAASRAQAKENKLN